MGKTAREAPGKASWRHIMSTIPPHGHEIFVADASRRRGAQPLANGNPSGVQATGSIVAALTVDLVSARNVPPDDFQKGLEPATATPTRTIHAARIAVDRFTFVVTRFMNTCPHGLRTAAGGVRMATESIQDDYSRFDLAIQFV
jgi:hypothetical protein